MMQAAAPQLWQPKSIERPRLTRRLDECGARIILLLVITELGAMIVAARGWPRPEVLIGALLGGSMAAGGAGAVPRRGDGRPRLQARQAARRGSGAGAVAGDPGSGLGEGESSSPFRGAFGPPHSARGSLPIHGEGCR